MSLNDKLIREGDALLYKHRLLELLESYGEVIISGSYALDMMTWRDLDLYVDSAQMSMDKLYLLVEEVCRIFSPTWCEFKDSRNENSGCPQGFFLGFETEILGSVWNIDIWFVHGQYLVDNQKYILDLKERFKDHPGAYMLKQELTKDPGYGQSFFSVDIYAAILAGVETPTEFFKWHKQGR